MKSVLYSKSICSYQTRLLSSSNHSILRKIGIAASAADLNNSSNPLDGDETSTSNSNTMSTSEFRKMNQITIRGKDTDKYDPYHTFEDAKFTNALNRVLVKEGYTKPTATQSQSWPIAMDGRDIISIARTGSGKTCGFLLPAIHKILMNRMNNGNSSSVSVSGNESNVRIRRAVRRTPSALILAPTRELAMQIESEASKYASATNLSTCIVYGGISKGPQISQLRQGCDIVIGTPGRVNDLIELGVLNLSNVTYSVLDEADRMLDMGFEPQIRQVFETMPEERQTLFFTATWPKEVQSLAMEFLVNPVQLMTGGNNDGLNANKAIKQNIIMVKSHEKEDRLIQLLDDLVTESGHEVNTDAAMKSFPKTIIFVSRKLGCDDVALFVSQYGVNAAALHGGMSQEQRTKVMERFRNGRLRVLVATDIAARGLDVKDIENVINYDFPNGVEDYVHRIGRTARGERVGKAFTFFNMVADRSNARELVDVLKRADQEVPDQLQMLVSNHHGSFQPNKYANRYNSGGGGGGNRYGGGGGGRFGGGNGGGGGSGNRYGGDRYGGDTSGGRGDRGDRYSDRSSNSRPSYDGRSNDFSRNSRSGSSRRSSSFDDDVY